MRRRRFLRRRSAAASSGVAKDRWRRESNGGGGGWWRCGLVRVLSCVKISMEGGGESGQASLVAHSSARSVLILAPRSPAAWEAFSLAAS